MVIDSPPVISNVISNGPNIRGQVPNILCPICACMFCWPLGIGALTYYIKAKKAKGTLFKTNLVQ